MAVIFGGRSVEHEVSLVSAKTIIKNIDTARFLVLPVFIDKAGVWRRVSIGSWLKGGGLETSEWGVLSPSLDPKDKVFYEIGPSGLMSEHEVDIMFPVLHGTYGEDGTIQGLLELMDIPYVGASVLGSSVGMDKIVTKAVLRDAGIPVVPHLWFYSHEWEGGGKTGKEAITNRIVEEIGTPCYVKSANLGSSVGITKVDTADDLAGGIDLASGYSERVIVECAVANPREIEVSVLGNESPIVSVPGEIVPKGGFYDYKAKYVDSDAELIAPAELDEATTEKVREYAVRAYRAIDCAGMSRVDFLIDGNTGDIFVSELNTIPGFTEISMYPKLWEASGIAFQELVTRLIDLALERGERSKRLKRDYSSDEE